MSDVITTTSTATGPIPLALNDAIILTAARSAAVASDKFTMRRLGFNAGLTHRFNKHPGLTASAVGETDAVFEAQGNAVVAVTLTAAQQAVAVRRSETLSDIAETTYEPSLLIEIGRAMTDRVEALVLALASALNGGTSVGTTGQVLSRTALILGRQTLATNKAASGNFGDGQTPAGLAGAMIFLSPKGTGDLEREMVGTSASPFSSIDATDILYSDGSKPAGYRGKIFGIPVFETENVQTVSSDRTGMIAMPSAIGVLYVGTPKVSTVSERAAGKFFNRTIGDFYVGVGELVDTFGVPITYVAA